MTADSEVRAACDWLLAQADQPVDLRVGSAYRTEYRAKVALVQAAADHMTLKIRAAAAVMVVIDTAVRQHVLDARSPIADARLDYGEPTPAADAGARGDEAHILRLGNMERSVGNICGCRAWREETGGITSIRIRPCNDALRAEVAERALADAGARARVEAIRGCAKAACGSPHCGPDHVLDNPLRLWAMCGATRLVRNGSITETEIIRALLAPVEKKSDG